MRESKAIILAKIETTYGTDAAPAAASDAIQCSAPSFEIIGGRRERSSLLPYHGKLAPINVGEGIKLAFSVELRGAGVAPSTPPRIGRLLRACSFTETISASPAFTEYTPNSAENCESVSIYFYRDGILHKALGCVGTFKLGAKANEPAKLDFEFTGLYAGTHASDTAFPAPTFGDAALPPIFRNAAFSLHGYSAVIEALNVDVGNKIGKRPSANAASGVVRYFVSDREVKGDCDPEAVALATFNPWSLWDASTAGALSATIGSAVENKCIVSLPSIVPESSKYAGREGVLAYAYAFTAHPTLTAGNNELSLKFQ